MVGPNLTLLTYSNKAVAVGAVSFYVDHFVTGRISKFTYGISRHTPYQSTDPEHIRRRHKIYLNPEGEQLLPDCFSAMLSRVRQPPILINTLRQIHCITGYQGSGRPGNPTQAMLYN